MGKIFSLTEVQRVQVGNLPGERYTEIIISAKLRYSITAVHNAIIKCNTDGTFRDRK